MNELNLQEEKHGPWEHFHINGKLQAKGSYEHGQRHGPWEYFLQDGTLQSKGSYHHGIKKGTWIGQWIEP